YLAFHFRCSHPVKKHGVALLDPRSGFGGVTSTSLGRASEHQAFVEDWRSLSPVESGAHFIERFTHDSHGFRIEHRGIFQDRRYYARQWRLIRPLTRAGE